MTRQQIVTTTAPYEDRLKVWQEACEAARRHIQLARAIQNTGGKVLKQIQEETLDGLTVSKLYSQALSNIERGAKIERDAHQALIELSTQQPRA